jgi:hypothetical protein
MHLWIHEDLKWTNQATESKSKDEKNPKIEKEEPGELKIIVTLLEEDGVLETSWGAAIDWGLRVRQCWHRSGQKQKREIVT